MQRTRARTVALSLLSLTLLAPLRLAAQDPAPATPAQAADRLRLFLDCPRCDQEYLRTEIKFAEYVRDRTDANIHALVTTQQTGAGGTEYSFQFVGLGPFQGVTEELRYASGP